MGRTRVIPVMPVAGKPPVGLLTETGRMGPRHTLRLNYRTEMFN